MRVRVIGSFEGLKIIVTFLQSSRTLLAEKKDESKEEMRFSGKMKVIKVHIKVFM